MLAGDASSPSASTVSAFRNVHSDADRAKLQRDRAEGSRRLNLAKPGDLAFYLGVLLYYGAVMVQPSLRYFIRAFAQRPT
jgi:hypothetical protein